MPVACGFATRKLDVLPLLLLQARSGRVSSSPRTYSAARAASPAGGPRGGGEEGGGDTPAARGQEVGATEAPAVAPGSQPAAAAATRRLSLRRLAPQVAQAGGLAGLRACMRSRWLSPAPLFSASTAPPLTPRRISRKKKKKNPPWICRVCGNPTWNAAQGLVPASRRCRAERNGQ